MEQMQETKISVQEAAGMTRRQYNHYVFTVYALAKKAARVGAIEEGRLNKALGIVMSRHYQTSTGEDYEATPRSCTCKDWEYRSASKRQTKNGMRYTGACKHMIAAMMEIRIAEMIENDTLAGLFGQNVQIAH